MKKPIVILVVIVVLGAIVWLIAGQGSSVPSNVANQPTSAPQPVSETAKVSDKLLSYKNEELGFTVNYPSNWQIITSDPASLILDEATDKLASNTIKKLESKVVVTSGKCAFPPVTTIKDRSTLTNGDKTFNMISMSNSVQGNNYFDRMYSLQSGSICYIFSFSSIVASPVSSGFKGSEATQATNNNKAIVDSADQAFTTMVKSFDYVTTPAGQDETSVVPTKK